MTTGTLNIHTENILPIIKKWLYSDKEIFIRELISNACDAIQKCRVLREHGVLSVSDETFRIDLEIDKKERTLKFTDNGIGMTSEEVVQYIAQVAFSGAEDFLSKYTTQNEGDQIIGHFGLGFYSAYMVAEHVTIDTLSFQEQAKPARWKCDGSATYTLEEGSHSTRGTEITLSIDKESDEFLEEERIRSILKQYCAFLPFPIFLNGTRINHKPPLWLEKSSQCTDQDYLEFYRALYPLEPDPLFWIHLNVDYPFHLQGILYFPKITSRFDWNQNTIKLFCNRVFVSDNCKDLIPDYLMILRGALDSPDIPLNVSRSTLQMDKTVRQLAQHISKKITDRLSALYTTEKEKFYEAWENIEMIVKLGILQDEKFYERAKEFIIWKNHAKEWTTLTDYLERNREKHKGKIFYTADDHNASLLNLYRDQGIEILYASSPIDAPLISFLESKLEDVTFQRIDGAIDSSILDPTREKTLLDADGKTQAVKIADCIRHHLDTPDVKIEAKSLQSDKTPGFLVIDEAVRRMRETFALTQQTLPSHFAQPETLVVNTNNTLIQSIYRLENTNPELSKEMTQHLYDVIRLSQRNLDPSVLPAFIERSHQLLEKLADINK